MRRVTMMYSTCLHCTRDLGRNQMIETLPVGRRLAFDADKGRLWVVCSSCGKWNLVPFDTRLESIDACEQLFRDTRTRYSTDNIGMAKVGDGLTLVRVGKALRPEFASWRYGEQYRKRMRKAVGIASIGAVGIIGTAVAVGSALGVGLGGMSYLLFQSGHNIYNDILNRRARIRTLHPESSEPILLEMPSLRKASIVWEDGQPLLRVPRPGPSSSEVFNDWRNEQLPTIGRRVTAGLNLTLGRASVVANAVGHLASHDGDLADWIRREARWQRKQRADGPVPKGMKEKAYRTDLGRDLANLSQMEPEHRLAVEMWFSEDIERRWLEGELRLLEREWREAEKLAKIADDLVLDDGA